MYSASASANNSPSPSSSTAAREHPTTKSFGFGSNDPSSSTSRDRSTSSNNNDMMDVAPSKSEESEEVIIPKDSSEFLGQDSLHQSRSGETTTPGGSPAARPPSETSTVSMASFQTNQTVGSTAVTASSAFPPGPTLGMADQGGLIRPTGRYPGAHEDDEPAGRIEGHYGHHHPHHSPYNHHHGGAPPPPHEQRPPPPPGSNPAENMSSLSQKDHPTGQDQPYEHPMYHHHGSSMERSPPGAAGHYGGGGAAYRYQQQHHGHPHHQPSVHHHHQSHMYGASHHNLHAGTGYGASAVAAPSMHGHYGHPHHPHGGVPQQPPLPPSHHHVHYGHHQQYPYDRSSLAYPHAAPPSVPPMHHNSHPHYGMHSAYGIPHHQVGHHNQIPPPAGTFGGGYHHHHHDLQYARRFSMGGSPETVAGMESASARSAGTRAMSRSPSPPGIPAPPSTNHPSTTLVAATSQQQQEKCASSKGDQAGPPHTALGERKNGGPASGTHPQGGQTKPSAAGSGSATKTKSTQDPTADAASILLALGGAKKEEDSGASSETASMGTDAENRHPVGGMHHQPYSSMSRTSHFMDEASVNTYGGGSLPDITSEPSTDSTDRSIKSYVPPQQMTTIPESEFPCPVPEKYPRRLALQYDASKLNSLHCFLRSELLEIFVVEKSLARSPMHSPGSSVGRVGLRCVHCAMARKLQGRSERDEAPMAVFYPKSIAEIYRLVTSWQRCHLRKCRNLPPSVRSVWQMLRENDKSRGKTHYWVTAAKQIGLLDCQSRAGGVRFAPHLNEFPAAMTSSSIQPREGDGLADLPKAATTATEPAAAGTVVASTATTITKVEDDRQDRNEQEEHQTSSSLSESQEQRTTVADTKMEDVSAETIKADVPITEEATAVDETAPVAAASTTNSVATTATLGEPVIT